MRRWACGVTALVTICTSGCVTTTAISTPFGSTTITSLSAPSVNLDIGAAKPYDLLTHCGVREALIENKYYLASPVLDDGNGNPPTGWGNPYDSGTITINADGTADFRDSAGHEAHFVLRPGATMWLQACA